MSWFRLELDDEFAKIILSTGHHRGLFVCVKGVFFLFFFLVFKFLYDITKLHKRKVR